jgi:hypothetical protein
MKVQIVSSCCSWSYHLDRVMKTQLDRCLHGKRTVAEYDMELNQIACFVPYVAHDEYEKARIFR